MDKIQYQSQKDKLALSFTVISNLGVQNSYDIREAIKKGHHSSNSMSYNL